VLKDLHKNQFSLLKLCLWWIYFRVWPFHIISFVIFHNVLNISVVLFAWLNFVDMQGARNAVLGPVILQPNDALMHSC